MVYINSNLFILWLFTSYPLAFLTVIIFYLLNFPIVLILRPTSRYKACLMKSLASFLNTWVLNLKVDVEGLENIPQAGPIVAYANHKSYTDAFAILQFFPRPITLTPKKTVLKIPFLKWWLKAYDVFPINRNSPKETLKDLEKAVSTVKNNHVILVFPEGSIKDRLSLKVEHAKAGSFRLVKEAQADILPIRFLGNDLARKRWPRRSKRKIIIYPPIPYQSFKDLNTKDIAKIFMDVINQES
jgi:1-acyl-sn-glycerol-3-phosphate acyltransferase